MRLLLVFGISEWVMREFGGGKVVMVITNWWEEVNHSVGWQDGIFFTLAALFAIVSLVALISLLLMYVNHCDPYGNGSCLDACNWKFKIQLIRIQLRVPEYGWTTQKVFHLMNFIVNGVRAIEFGLHNQVYFLKPEVLKLVLLDLPGLLFFSTYTLLVLFWAEIYHQARSKPADKLRLFYVLINGGIYFIQVCIWILIWLDNNSVVEFVGRVFIAAVALIASLGFLVYGGRLFVMLKQFPIESRGRRKKLYEVGLVTAICFTCFLIRCVMVFISAVVADASLDVLYHPILDFLYYMLVEILPSALVLFILRKLPPKRLSAQYHPIY